LHRNYLGEVMGMKKIMVAMMAVMFLVGFNAVSFADEKAGEHKGMEMKGDAKGGETKGDAKGMEKKDDTKKKEEKKKK
jgi:hypothetical protein